MADYYLDSVNGSNSNNGLAPEPGGGSVGPWQTVSAINSTTFSAGDTIHFRTGQTFTGNISINDSGSSGNPITFTNYDLSENADLPVLDGNNTGYTILLDGADFILIEAISITNGDTLGSDGVFCGNGCSNLVVRGCRFEQCYHAINSDVGFSHPSGLVEHCSFYDQFSDAVSIHSNTGDRWTVRRCTFELVGSRDTALASGDAVSCHGQMLTDVEDCYILNCKKGITHVHTTGTCNVNRCIIIGGDHGANMGTRAWLQMRSNAGTTVVRNTVMIAREDTVAGAIIAETDTGVLTMENCTVLIDASAAIFGLYSGLNGNGTLNVTNCVVVDNGGAARMALLLDASDVYNGVNNRYHPDSATAFNAFTVDGNFASWSAAPGVTETGSVVGDPQVQDPSGGSGAPSAAPQGGSPLIDAGAAVSGLTRDLWNSLRFGALDVGAIEYEPSRAGMPGGTSPGALQIQGLLSPVV